MPRRRGIVTPNSSPNSGRSESLVTSASRPAASNTIQPNANSPSALLPNQPSPATRAQSRPKIPVIQPAVATDNMI
jgi:hypothetical protein